MRSLAACAVALGAVAAAEPDPVLAAAESALAAGRPADAAVLLRRSATAPLGQARLVLARAQLQLGRCRNALDSLAAEGEKWWEAWPEVLRGQVCAVAGEALATLDEPAADEVLLAAVAAGARGVDRPLILLAERRARAGDTMGAGRAARRLWEDHPRSPWRARAGVIFARALAEERADEALAVLAAVRVDRALAPADLLAAAELSCRLLLTRRPGHCLVVAELEMRRLPPEGQGELPLLRALALAALDAAEGAAALRALPPALAASPAAVSRLVELERDLTAGRAADMSARLERAEAAAELGRWDDVLRLVEPFAAESPAAATLLARVPGADLRRLEGAQALRDPGAAVAVARAHLARGAGVEAWRSVRAAGEAPSASPATLWWAAESAAAAGETAARDALRARLRALPGPGVETGLAWMAEAQALDDAGADAGPAWRRAALALPAAHPWRAPAAWRWARAQLAAGVEFAELDAVLADCASAPGEDGQRCRLYRHIHPQSKIWKNPG